jgi:hypothetical protein
LTGGWICAVHCLNLQNISLPDLQNHYILRHNKYRCGRRK